MKLCFLICSSMRGTTGLIITDRLVAVNKKAFDSSIEYVAYDENLCAVMYVVGRRWFRVLYI
jgi:hypothetical protein